MKALFIILILSTFLNCKGQEEKPLIKINNCESLIAEKQELLWDQLADFQNTYFPNEERLNYTWNYDFVNNKISVLRNSVPYLNIDFVHVGKINVAKETWTWSWDNLQNEVEFPLQDVKKFGIENNCKKLTDASWSGLEKDAWNMVAITNYILNTKGGARHYAKTEYNYVVFTKIEKL